MIPADVANDDLIDYTRTLQFLAHHLMAPGCRVELTPRQFETLKEYLSKIEAVGDGINFQLEMCVNHNPGHSVSWDNDGSREQDDEVDHLMMDMVKAMGFA